MHTRSVLTALAALLLTVAASLLVSSPPAGAAPGWSWPVEGEVLTGYRNGDDPYAGGQHRGIDIAAQAGTPVGAAAAGTVRFAGVAGSSGLTVSVRTSDGMLDTSYLHLSAVAVREGDQVAAGQRLGAVGTTGRRAVKAPHLHFGVRDAGSRHAYHDPLSYLPPAAPRAAPEPPRVPVPVTAPVPVAPAPARAPDPLRVPAGRRVRLPATRRVRVPAGRRLRMPVGRRAPGAAPAPVPVRVPALGRAPVPVHSGAPVPALAGDPAAAVAQGAPRPAEGASGQSVPRLDAAGVGPFGSADRLGAIAGADRAPTADPRPAAAERGPGPDIGWALACAGLLLAAALVGRAGDQEGSGSPRERARAGAAVKLRALIKPLTGSR